MHTRIIGDVHGCFHSFERLLKTWDPEHEILIQIGDLVDRGRYIPQTLALARKLQDEHPDSVVFLRGNHEDELLTLFNSGYDMDLLIRMGSETLSQYRTVKRDFLEDLAWIKAMPLYYESHNLFVSHAGISIRKAKTMDLVHFLWHRDPILNIGKVQVYGHTPQFDFMVNHDPATDSWNIDTACVYSGKLSALVLDETGQFVRIDQIDTDLRDRVEW